MAVYFEQERLGNYLEQIFPFLGVRFIAVKDDYDSKDPNCVGNLVSDLTPMLYQKEYHSLDLWLAYHSAGNINPWTDAMVGRTVKDLRYKGSNYTCNNRRFTDGFSCDNATIFVAALQEVVLLSIQNKHSKRRT